jgi:hypothetical protein
MDKKSILNAKYLQLCQQLGDAVLKSEQLQEHIQLIKSQIKTLDASYPIILELDQTLNTHKQHKSPKESNNE